MLIVLIVTYRDLHQNKIAILCLEGQLKIKVKVTGH
jgi:hypothetical protein